MTSETTGGVVDRGETGERRRERGGGRNRGEGREEVFREVRRRRSVGGQRAAK